MRRLRVVLGLLGSGVISLIVISLVAAPVGASGPTLSIGAEPGIVNFREPAPSGSRIAGALWSGKQGVKLELVAQRWPFNVAPRQVASTRTGRYGRYAFSVQPTLATRYEVTAGSPHAKSATRTVFVVPGYSIRACAFTRPHETVSCAHAHHLAAGKWTWHWSYDAFYPASAYSAEKGKPVYSYLGQRNGSSSRQPPPPSTLSLQGTVAQQPQGGNKTYVAFWDSVTIPHTGWSVQARACEKKSEQSDGLGLPGPPGSHHCGQQMMTYGEALSPALG